MYSIHTVLNTVLSSLDPRKQQIHTNSLKGYLDRHNNRYTQKVWRVIWTDTNNTTKDIHKQSEGLRHTQSACLLWLEHTYEHLNFNCRSSLGSPARSWWKKIQGRAPGSLRDLQPRRGRGREGPPPPPGRCAIKRVWLSEPGIKRTSLSEPGWCVTQPRTR